MRAATKAGFVTGGVVGIAIGAGLLMSPSGKQVRKMVNMGTNKLKNGILHGHIG